MPSKSEPVLSHPIASGPKPAPVADKPVEGKPAPVASEPVSDQARQSPSPIDWAILSSAIASLFVTIRIYLSKINRGGHDA